MFFLLNSPPGAASDLSQHLCVYNFTFLILPVSALRNIPVLFLTALQLPQQPEPRLHGWVVSELCSDCRMPDPSGVWVSHFTTSLLMLKCLAISGTSSWRDLEIFPAGIGLLEDICELPMGPFLNLQSFVVYYWLLTLFLGPFCLYFKMIPNPSNHNYLSPNKTVAWVVFVYDR